MLLSFLVYTITAVALAYLGWHANTRERSMLEAGGKRLPFYCWEIVASIVLFAIVAGARYKTGYDYIYYYSQYVQMRDMQGFSRHDYEWGFVLITKLFAAIKAHEFFYFAFWGGLQLGLFYYAFRKNKSLLPWLALIIMLGGYFVGWMNTIRQVVVECAFVALVPMCTSWRKTFIACAIAMVFASIHVTALLIVVYLLCMYSLRNTEMSRRSCLVVYTVFVLLGIYPFWLKWMGGLGTVMVWLDYSKYVPLLNKLIAGEFKPFGMGPGHLCLILSQVLVMWYYPLVKKDNPDDKVLRNYYFLAFWGMCLSSLLINTAHYMLRPVEILTLCVPVMLAYTMRTLYRKRNYIGLGFVCVSTLSVIYMAVVKAVYAPTSVNTPYLYNILFLN